MPCPDDCVCKTFESPTSPITWSNDRPPTPPLDYNRHLKLPRRPDSPRPPILNSTEVDESAVCLNSEDGTKCVEVDPLTPVNKKRRGRRRKKKKPQPHPLPTNPPPSKKSSAKKVIRRKGQTTPRLVIKKRNSPSFQWKPHVTVSKHISRMRYYLKSFNFIQEMKKPHINGDVVVERNYLNFCKLYELHWDI